jgi:hypothetical protein
VEPPPPELGVPLAGGVDEAGGTVPPVEGAGAGVPELGVPPPDPPIGVPVSDPSFAFLFFFLSPGCTGSPVVTGGTTGTVVWLELELSSPPPLDAIATTTISKKATTASAASLRRR